MDSSYYVLISYMFLSRQRRRFSITISAHCMKEAKALVLTDSTWVYQLKARKSTQVGNNDNTDAL